MQVPIDVRKARIFFHDQTGQIYSSAFRPDDLNTGFRGAGLSPRMSESFHAHSPISFERLLLLAP